MFGTVFDVGNMYEVVSPIGQGAYGVVVAAKINRSAVDGEQQPDSELGGVQEEKKIQDQEED